MGGWQTADGRRRKKSAHSSSAIRDLPSAICLLRHALRKRVWAQQFSHFDSKPEDGNANLEQAA